MKEDEILVCSFLAWLDAGRVTYEPEGHSTFPDFSINDQAIGVEARRLNRYFVVSGQKAIGFEGAERSIMDGLRKEFREAGPSVGGECWHVDVRLQRPVEWVDVRRDVRAKLEGFRTQAVRNSAVLMVSGALELHLTRASKDHGVFFFTYVQEDKNAACNVLAEVEVSLRISIEEKKGKVIPPIQQKYAEWWLVLVNRVDLSMRLDDYVGFGERLDPPLAHPFARIYLIDPFDYRRWVMI